MSVYLEALLLLLPPDAGGRSEPVSPRDGSYRPFVRHGARIVRARVFEGPPRLAPGDAGRVMVELESGMASLDRGVELELLERDEHLVGFLTVLRICRSPVLV